MKNRIEEEIFAFEIPSKENDSLSKFLKNDKEKGNFQNGKIFENLLIPYIRSIKAQ